jgi:hypothetical protein
MFGVCLLDRGRKQGGVKEGMARKLQYKGLDCQLVLYKPEYLSGAPQYGSLLALPTNIKQVWPTRRNTLAYFKLL